MIFNEIVCHVNTFLGLVGGDASPAPPSCVRAWLAHGDKLTTTKIIKIKWLLVYESRSAEKPNYENNDQFKITAL